MTATCTINLIRHGTTSLNKYHRYRGTLQVPLDDKGWTDAHAVAAELAGAGLSAVYTSPLRRARDTAQTVADAAGLPHIIDIAEFNNLDYGAWTAMTSAEAKEYDPAEFERYQTCSVGATCPDGEGLDAGAERMIRGLLDIGRRHPGETIAAVSHAAMVRLALVATGSTSRPSWRRSLPNGSVTVFEVSSDGLRYAGVPEALALVRH